MKTNWRRIGVLADEVIRRIENARAAAGDGAQPGMSGDPLVKEGGPASGSPTRAVDEPRDGKEAGRESPSELPGANGGGSSPGVNRSRTGDGWVIRPPAVRRSPKAPAASKEHVKEPSPTPEDRPVLPQRVKHDGKSACEAQSNLANSP